jgi:hypothetical protein
MREGISFSSIYETATYVVPGDGAGRVARDELDLGGHGPVHEPLLYLPRSMQPAN